MRMWITATVAALAIANTAWAGGPNGGMDAPLPIFRVTSAEVHLTFTAARDKNQLARDIARGDFQILRDGRQIEDIVSFSPYNDGALSTLVMVDVSDSMLPGLSLERAASQWLQSNSDAARDRVSFLDFGNDVQPDNKLPISKRHLTSLYDALMEVLPKFARLTSGRRSLILMTDGIDNYSLHSLYEVIAMAQRYDIAVYAVTAHPDKKQFYRADVLELLCNETGGRYFEVRKTDAMIAAVSQITQELRNGYDVVFRPDSATAGMHEVSIHPTQRKLRFFHRTAYFQPTATNDVASLR